MQLVELVILLSVIQLVIFSFFVGRARTKFGLPLPSMAGNLQVERYIRGHLNSVESIVVFVPALTVASHYWNPAWIAGLGLIYIVGRTLYFIGYTQSVEKRGPGFLISALSTVALIGLALVGLARSF